MYMVYIPYDVIIQCELGFLQISEICCITSVLNEFKMGHCSKKCISSSISNLK
jgi:hypothetical protein